MENGLIIASIDRAGGHVVVLLIAAGGGLLYGLIHLVVKRRRDQARRDHGPESGRGPEA